MAEVDGERGDGAWCMGEYIVWGGNDSEVHPSFRASRKQSARHLRYLPSTNFT